MKHYVNKTGAGLKKLFLLLLLAGFLKGYSQKKAEIVDLQLNGIELQDLSGHAVNVNDLYLDQVIRLKLVVNSISNGNEIPVGACKLKIGFGTRLVLDPSFNMNDANNTNYFRWSTSTADGQTQVTGELRAALPASVKELPLLIKVKGNTPGTSAITANFLVTNHNTNTIVSDQDGANNAASVKYIVSEKRAPVDNNAELTLSIYPNPALGAGTVINAVTGQYRGRYRFVMFDATGKKVKTSDLQLIGVKTVKYETGNIAPGNYLIQVTDIEKGKIIALRFEKM